MIITTTPSVDGYIATQYLGIVFGEVIAGVNFVKDFAAGINNILGGRVDSYEDELVYARDQALDELRRRAERLGADAVVGVKVDYETLGNGLNMLMVTACGTAVRLEKTQERV